MSRLEIPVRDLMFRVVFWFAWEGAFEAEVEQTKNHNQRLLKTPRSTTKVRERDTQKQTQKTAREQERKRAPAVFAKPQRKTQKENGRE